jgi:hypothetical protein
VLWSAVVLAAALSTIFMHRKALRVMHRKKKAQIERKTSLDYESPGSFLL